MHRKYPTLGGRGTDGVTSSVADLPRPSLAVA